LKLTLKAFLLSIGRVEAEIITYTGQDALEAVKRNGYALQYVKDQTPEICTEAVKADGDALRYVDKKIFEPEEEIVEKSTPAT
jgi:Domain of unknown function (DUF4116)